jgi:O-antigen/teichoic acid export membrane protein
VIRSGRSIQEGQAKYPLRRRPYAPLRGFMSLMRQAVKNVSATWLGLLVHAVVGFLLAPFILHRLGDEAFSLWVLVFALTGYYGLLDLGIRSSIVNYTARFAATKDDGQLSRFLSTSLGFYAIVAVIVLLLTGTGFFYLQNLFRIPPTLVRSARLLFLLAGVSAALTFPLNSFAGVLEGLQKYSWLQLSNIGVTLLRALLVVIALRNGGGLLTVGIIFLTMNLLTYLIFTGMALHVLPIRLSLGQVERKAFLDMVSYGVFAFAIVLAEKLRFQSDAMVIGAFLPAAAITFFFVGSRLVEYSSYAVRSMSQIFTPMSSQFHAVGDLVRLQRAFTAGNRACALIIFPLCVTLLILGKSIIEAWVGAKYVTSYSVLVLLLVPRSIYLAQSTSNKILLGMGQHRILAFVLLLEGGVNLALSLFLVRRFGIIGVALGTAIPLACTSIFFLPRHACRVLDMPLGTFLNRAYWLPFLLCLPLAGVLLFAKFEFPAHSYAALLPQIACGGLIYCAGLGFALFNGGILSTGGVRRALEPK